MNEPIRMRGVPVHGVKSKRLPKVVGQVCRVPLSATDETDVQDWKRARRVRTQHAWFMREFVMPARRDKLN